MHIIVLVKIYFSMLLSELNIGQEKKVIKINCIDKVKARLNAMGLTEGVKVTLIRIAPLGDPLEIKVRDFYMAIRKNQAEKITVGEL